MITYAEAFEHIIKYEGYYANDPDDLGGETYMGISRVYWPKWNGWKIIDSQKAYDDFPKRLKNIESLTNEVKNFYKTNFWDKVKGDALSVMSKKVTLEVFDASVNMGVKRASKFLQTALNTFNRNQQTYADLVVDGAIGNKTISALRDYLKNDNDTLLSSSQCVLRGAYYIKRTQDDSTQEKFIRGWLKRMVIMNTRPVIDLPTISESEPPPVLNRAIPGTEEKAEFTSVPVNLKDAKPGQVLAWDGEKLAPMYIHNILSGKF